MTYTYLYIIILIDYRLYHHPIICIIFYMYHHPICSYDLSNAGSA
eukprot:COSAG01_NODE_4039_length_5406_cov_1.715980_8_plen_45_part_00